LASTPYMNAKKAGLAGALSVAADKITMTGFTLSRRLSEKGRSLAAVTVQTSYEVEVSASAAAAMQTTVSSNAITSVIQTQTTTAMAAQNWAGEPKLTAAPTVTVSAVAYTGTTTVTAAPTPSTSSAASTGVLSAFAAAVAFYALC